MKPVIPELDTEALHARLATVVGAEHVQALAPGIHYGALFGPELAADARPRAVVSPVSPEHLQRLLPMISRLGMGLWSTPNRCGNGARAGQSRKPVVLVDLSRMNRIIEIDRKAGYALLEPGVSFDALAAELHTRDLPYGLDATRNGAHSVVGSFIERAPSMTAGGDRLAMQCGLEAVLANGTCLRSGMGALPGSHTWPLFKAGFGPLLDGLFSRADFGIVTKLGVWLQPEPRRFLPFRVGLADLNALAASITALRPFKIEGRLPGTTIIANRGADAALFTYGNQEPLASGTAPWHLYGALYGLPKQVDYDWQSLSATLTVLPGIQLQGEHALADDAPGSLRVKRLQGQPAYSTPDGADDAQFSFTVVAPLDGGDALAMHRLLRARLAEFALSIEFQLGARALAMRVELAYGKADSAARRDAVLATVKALVAAGYGVSQCGLALEALLAARHTASGLRHLYDGLHTALDPFATLAPHGKFTRAKH